MSAEAVRNLFTNLVCPLALSHYADPYPSTNLTNNQLVPYTKDAAKSKTTLDGKDLDTHDGLFQKYESFHRLSGDQDREARTSTYHELINLMLSQMTEDKKLINVSAVHPKSDGPFHSNQETQPKLKKKQDKLHLQWPHIKKTQRVVDRALGLYQHVQQPSPVVLPLSGLPLPWKPTGTKSSPLRTSQLRITSLQLCPNVGSFMRTLH